MEIGCRVFPSPCIPSHSTYAATEPPSPPPSRRVGGGSPASLSAGISPPNFPPSSKRLPRSGNTHGQANRSSGTPRVGWTASEERRMSERGERTHLPEKCSAFAELVALPTRLEDASSPTSTGASLAIVAATSKGKWCLGGWKRHSPAKQGSGIKAPSPLPRCAVCLQLAISSASLEKEIGEGGQLYRES